jgi:hypothetical protein
MDPNVEKILEAAASGAVCYGAVYMILGNFGTIPIAGMEFSPAAGMAVTVAGADLAANYLADELAKMNTMDEFDDTIKGAVKPALVGACSVAAGRLLIGNYSDASAMAKVAGLGAGSSIGGSYIADMVPK